MGMLLVENLSLFVIDEAPIKKHKVTQNLDYIPGPRPKKETNLKLYKPTVGGPSILSDLSVRVKNLKWVVNIGLILWGIFLLFADSTPTIKRFCCCSILLKAD